MVAMPQVFGSFDFQNWAITWLPIIFMGLIVFLIGWTLKHMPRTKPVQIKPSSGDSVRWDDVQGVEEAKEELREVVEFLRSEERRVGKEGRSRRLPDQ